MQFMKSNNKIDEIFKFNEVEIVIVNNKKQNYFWTTWNTWCFDSAMFRSWKQKNPWNISIIESEEISNEVIASGYSYVLHTPFMNTAN